MPELLNIVYKREKEIGYHLSVSILGSPSS